MALETIIILSIVQGITEFLPISSSAHLIIIPEIFGSISSKRSFDVSLHFGSLLAVIFYLKKDISKISYDTIFLKKNNEGFVTFKNLIISEAPTGTRTGSGLAWRLYLRAIFFFTWPKGDTS